MKNNLMGFMDWLALSKMDLRRYRFVLLNLISNNLRARYRRSVLGFLWSLLNPLFTMLILAIVFSNIYKVGFADFGLYLFSGLLPWQLMLNSVLHGSTSLLRAEGYLKKVYVPKILFPIVSVGIELMNFIFSIVGLSLIAVVLGARLGWGTLFLPVALFLTILFVLGIVLITSTLTVFFRDLPHILSVVFLSLFYLTPIVYKQGMFSSNLVSLLNFNPFFYFITLFHRIIYEGQIPELHLWVISASMAFGIMTVGLVVFFVKEKDIVYRL